MVSHQPSFHPTPLALLGGSLAVGVILAESFAPRVALCLTLLACFSILAALALKRRALTTATWLTIFAFASAGLTLAVVERETVKGDSLRRLYEGRSAVGEENRGERIASGEPVELTGVLVRAPEWSPEGFRFELRVERLSFKSEERAVSGKVELFLPLRDDGGSGYASAERAEYEALELRRGARVRVMVALTRAGKFRNPGVTPFDEHLERRALDAVGTVKSPLLVERLDDEAVFLPFVWLDLWRSRLVERANASFSPATAGILDAALLGNRYGLSRATAERFREGGTFHTLVISGLHITFLGAAAWWLARRATRRRSLQFAASVLLVWAYALAVGAEASVVRASLMFTAVALAPVLHRRAATLNALGGAALALLVWRPSELFDPSFQLSFVSVLIIVTTAWPLLTKLRAIGDWRPMRETPYPPACPLALKKLAEALFWSERAWRREMMRASYDYRLFKTPLAARLEGWRVQRAARYAFAAVLVSACVQLGMLPLMVVYFHRLSFASLVLNVFVGAGVALVCLSALAGLALACLSAPLAAPLFWLVEKASWLIEHGVDPFTAAGASSIRLPEYGGAAHAIYFIYYLPVALLAIALSRWHPLALAAERTDEKSPASRRIITRLAALWLAVLAALIVLHPLSAPRPDGKLHVDFLDVGQGDAALVTMPDGTTLLIDGAGRPRYDSRTTDGAELTARAEFFEFDSRSEPYEPDVRSVGEAVVSEYLWWRGLDAVDYVLATHADADHIDGLCDVVRNFRVRAALVARAPNEDPEFARFAAAARESGVPLYQIGAGDELKFDRTTADVLWPHASSDASLPSRNDDSIVLRLRFGLKKFLFTGDIERKAEAALLAAGEDLRSDVVKVAHHGSRTSSSESFVAATHASLAVISVGLDSPFGHPHPNVVECWRTSGAQVLTTGERGTINVSTDGRDLAVETYVKPSEGTR